MFYVEDRDRLARWYLDCAKACMGQFESCILDFIAAKDAVDEQVEHLDNAVANMQMFVGDGEVRWHVHDGVAHRVGNTNGTITIEIFERKSKVCL